MNRSIISKIAWGSAGLAFSLIIFLGLIGDNQVINDIIGPLILISLAAFFVRSIRFPKLKETPPTVQVKNSQPQLNTLTSTYSLPTHTTYPVSKSVNYGSIYKNASLKSIANFVSLDVETTGLGSGDKIVEIGMVKFENHKPADQYQTLINPGFPIPKAAIKVHGITDAMVATAPDFSVCIDGINNFIGDYPIVGHNINFDFRLMKQSGHKGFPENKVFDTLSIARKTIEAENNKLDTLCRHFQIERDQAHRSISDCFDTAKLFQCLFEEKTGKKIPK